MLTVQKWDSKCIIKGFVRIIEVHCFIAKYCRKSWRLPQVHISKVPKKHSKLREKLNWISRHLICRPSRFIESDPCPVHVRPSLIFDLCETVINGLSKIVEMHDNAIKMILKWIFRDFLAVFETIWPAE